MRKIRLQKSADSRLVEQFAADLNPAQFAAATAPDGYHLILAGPGSGKTRVITYRVAFLIAKGVPAESILLVTFTRRAAREMVSRLESLIGAAASRIWAGTFHHIGNRLLRRSAKILGFEPNFTILDSEDQRDLIKSAMTDALIYNTNIYAPKPATIQHLFSMTFNTGTPLETLIRERHPDLAEWEAEIIAAERHYKRRKLAANCMDYDDLLGLWAKLLDAFPEQLEAQARQFKHILIDEMQDTNTVQAHIIETLAHSGSNNLTAVGDDAQSIYRFRGANYDNILKFHERNPNVHVHRLEVNYRSTPEIVAFTNASIAQNTSGFGKTLVSARSKGMLPMLVPTADGYEEAEFLVQDIIQRHQEGLSLKQLAVLYRNHHDSILLQGELVSRGIPYQIRSGVRFFEQAHIKDAMAYLRVISNPREESSWKRLLQMIPGIGPAKSQALWEMLERTENPLIAIATAEVVKSVPAKSRGFFGAFVGDLMQIRAVNPETRPADALAAVLRGGYPETLKKLYDRAENRLADLEQLVLLAARYDNLERMISDLLLAGDIYGVDTIEAADPEDRLVLTSIHQAKGLEWTIVYLLRLNEDSFPNARSLKEEGGLEEERRVFYVAVTRAMDELILTYPQLTSRGPHSPQYIAKPSRFLTEIPANLCEPAMIERDATFVWPGLESPAAPPALTPPPPIQLTAEEHTG